MWGKQNPRGNLRREGSAQNHERSHDGRLSAPLGTLSPTFAVFEQSEHVRGASGPNGSRLSLMDHEGDHESYVDKTLTEGAAPFLEREAPPSCCRCTLSHIISLMKEIRSISLTFSGVHFLLLLKEQPHDCLTVIKVVIPPSKHLHVEMSL